MTRILLDTSAYSALMSGHDRVAERVREAEEIYLNAIVLGELLGGFARGSRRLFNERQIAASAMQHGLRLLTLDAHFRHVPQVLTDFDGV